MRFFIDTANVEEIRKANDMGVICGVTTNPSLIAKEGRDYAETLKEIASIVDGPISGEVKATTEDAETMIEEGRAIYALDPEHMVMFGHTAAPELCGKFAQKVLEKLPVAQYDWAEIGSTVGTHAGPGAVGAAFIKKG